MTTRGKVPVLEGNSMRCERRSFGYVCHSGPTCRWCSERVHGEPCRCVRAQAELQRIMKDRR